MKTLENMKIWPVWDSELNRFGEWTLVGAIACQTLPPLPAAVSMILLLYVGLTRAVTKAEFIFGERWDLRKKEDDGRITDSEREKIDRMEGDLRRANKTRNTRIYWVGYLFFFIMLLYTAARFLVTDLKHWIF